MAGVSESRGGRPGLPVPNKPNSFCGRKAPWKKKFKDFLWRQYQDCSCDVSIKTVPVVLISRLPVASVQRLFLRCQYKDCSCDVSIKTVPVVLISRIPVASVQRLFLRCQYKKCSCDVSVSEQNPIPSFKGESNGLPVTFPLAMVTAASQEGRQSAWNEPCVTLATTYDP